MLFLGIAKPIRKLKCIWEFDYSMGLFVREATLPSNNLVRLRSLVMMPLVMS